MRVFLGESKARVEKTRASSVAPSVRGLLSNGTASLRDRRPAIMRTCATTIVCGCEDHPRLMIYQGLSFARSDPTGYTRPSEIAFLVIKLTSLYLVSLARYYYHRGLNFSF